MQFTRTFSSAHEMFVLASLEALRPDAPPTLAPTISRMEAWVRSGHGQGVFQKASERRRSSRTHPKTASAQPGNSHMTRLAIEDLDEWRTTFSRLRKGIRSSCRSRPFERLLARCDEIYESGATEGSYSEEDYLTFAEDVLEAAERNAEGAQLPLDLTREHAGVQDFIHSTARFADAAYAALRHPDDWTSANHSVISEMVYSALAWEAKSVAKANNTEDLLDFLERHPAFSAKGGHFHRRSIIRWLVDFELRGNTETLEALSRTFSTDAGIARDLEKAREHHRRISDDPEVPGS